jgi:2-oxoglutarate ferredoxin oxidoreductase subunit beta
MPDGKAPAAETAREKFDFSKWLRVRKKFPHLWCPGCGLGIVLQAVVRSFHRLGYSKDDLVLVSGIGCTGRIPVYVDCNTLHTTHGRALTFATGIKLAKPRLKVVVFMGDGDALAIGGNHFIHAARRDIDLTAIVVNNAIYGMTGGQISPTTPRGMKSTTTPKGHFGRPFDICDLACAAGATYVARSIASDSRHMQRMMREGLEHKGFSMIEIISNCHTAYGRINRLGDHLDMLQGYRARAVNHVPDLDVRKAKEEGKIIVGLLHCDEQKRSHSGQVNGTIHQEDPRGEEAGPAGEKKE